jgi:hypothetical protein
MKHRQPLVIRQGDVALVAVNGLPADCTPVPLDHGRIVLAYGEQTGHAHAIRIEFGPEAAAEIAGAAIARAKAKLWQTASGDRYLQVLEPVSLTHEEHTAHTIPAGIFELPVQVEHDTANAPRVVAD